MTATVLVLVGLVVAPAASWTGRPPHVAPRRRAHSRAMAASSSRLASVEEAEEAVQLIANLTGVVDVEKCLPRLAGLLAAAPTSFPAGDERHGSCRFVCWNDCFETSDGDRSVFGG